MTNREVIEKMDNLTLAKWIYTDCQTIGSGFTYSKLGIADWLGQEAPSEEYEWIDEMIYKRYNTK